jgi:hypothetical protein
LKELLIGDEPKKVFPSDNDRVVAEASQRQGLPGNTLAMTAMTGRTDHVVIRHTPGLSIETCLVFDPVDGPRVRADFRDFNLDQTLDVTCRVIQLLEANPSGHLFFRN